ncbi:septation ring formation regulator EzrA [Bacillus timonensis]|nr:septation ring formation regulator EzrA [Bacillus timonensis]
MEIIIGIIILIVTIASIGFYLRKKIYQEVDRLELWKIDIMNRPVTDEISKVKELNMTGQTEEMFERWRNNWDEIVTNQLPEVEELLFETEEFADKYRFKKSKLVIQKIEHILQNVEDSISDILKELQNLIGSEELNRIEAEELKQLYRDLKKTLLAQRHSFGKAESKLEKMLDEVNKQFKEFEDLTELGNYLSAREMILTIKGNLAELDSNMENIPALLTECQSILPSQLDEIVDGNVQMREQGYILDHIQVEKEVNRIRIQLQEYVTLLEDSKTEEVSKGIGECKESIETLYDLLEKEVSSKHYVTQNIQAIEENLNNLQEDCRQTEEETNFVQLSYHVSDDDLEAYKTIVKQIKQLVKKFISIKEKLSEDHVAYTVIHEGLEQIKAQLTEVSKQHIEYGEKIQTLRKDELFAREKITEMKRQLSEIQRLLMKSNIPGLPSTFEELLTESKESVVNVLHKLDEKPLNMTAVNSLLTTAMDIVSKTYESTEELIEQVYFSERVIQYGNRYRSTSSFVAGSLKEAERSFRQFHYNEALKLAATAIEEIEPGALKRIQRLIENE